MFCNVRKRDNVVNGGFFVLVKMVSCLGEAAEETLSKELGGGEVGEGLCHF